MSRVGGSRPHKTTTTRRREKREERRAKSEERRKKRKETPKEAAKGPQMRPPEGGQPFSRPSRPLMGPLAASRAEGREQRKERREKKKEKTRLCLFFVECGRGVPQGSRELIPVQMARGGGLRGKNTPQLGHPTLKNPLFSEGKQAFLQNRSFASKDGWDRVLRPLVDVWGPLEKARGRDSTHPKKRF